MLVAGDVYRPAAIDQLVILGQQVIFCLAIKWPTLYFCLFILILKSSLWQVGVPVYTAGIDVKPSQNAKEGLEEAKKKNIDVVIVDTAGRLQVIYLFL